MDMTLLRAELTTDPLARGYAGMSDAAAAASLNARDRDAAQVSSDDVARYILEEGRWPELEDLAAGTGGYSGATANQRKAARAALAIFTNARLPTIRLKRAKVQAMLDLMVGAGALTAGDKTALNALADAKFTRAEELGLGVVTDGYVFKARMP